MNIDEALATDNVHTKEWENEFVNNVIDGDDEFEDVNDVIKEPSIDDQPPTSEDIINFDI